MPKTVFVSPHIYLLSDQNIFREQMKHTEALKFSWNFDKGGIGMRAVTSYGITKGLHQWHYNLVPRRLKTIVSNGILVLWREWANLNLRLKFFQTRNAAVTQTQYFMPLSLCSSHMYFVFVLFIFVEHI